MDSSDFLFDFEDPYEPVVHQIKTPDEIKKYVVDEKLGPVDRFLYILSKGEDVQKHSALISLSDLLRNLEPKEKENVLKKVLSFFTNNCNEEFNSQMAKQVPKLLQAGLVSEALFHKYLLPIVLNGSSQIKVSSIVQAWNTSLLDIIPLLSKEAIRKDILPLVRKNSDLRQTVQTRVFACKLISRMAASYDTSSVIQEFLPIVKHLCQDIEYEVRWNMCVNLVPIAAKLPSATTVDSLFPELVELTNDEEKVVKFHALFTLVDFVPYLDEDSIVQSVVPIVDKYIESTSLKNDPYIVDLSKVFGKLCCHLYDYLTDDQKNYYLSFYRKLSQNGISDSSDHERTRKDSYHFMPSTLQKPNSDKMIECRQYAAFNFPALLSFCGGGKYEQQLDMPLNNLVTDPDICVRKTIASGFHEAVKLMAPKALLLELPLYELLSDKNLEVKKAITKHLDVILLYMYDPSISDVSEKCMQDKILAEILDSFETLKSSHDWRATANIIRHLSSIANCFSDDVTYKQIYPLILNIVTSHSSRPIKAAACETLAWLLRCNRKYDQRCEMLSSIIKLAGSHSSAQRLMFIEVCHCLARQFSRRFFKDNLMEPLLNLCSDNVIDVRLALSKFLPFLKSMLRLPVDRTLLHRLELSVRSLVNQDYHIKNSTNSSLTSTIRHYTLICDQQQIEIESAIDLVPKDEKDREDSLKEEEERAVEFNYKNRRRKTIGVTKPSDNKSNTVSSKSSSTDSNGKVPVRKTSIGGNGGVAGGPARSSPSNASPTSPQSNSTPNVSLLSPPPNSKSGPISIKAASQGSPSPSQPFLRGSPNTGTVPKNGLNSGRRGSMPCNLLPLENVVKKNSKGSAKK